MKHSRRSRGLVAALAGAGIWIAACAPPPPKPPAPAPTAAAPAPTAAPAPPEREGPPASGPARELALPAPIWDELPNGLRVATVVSPALPIVQIRIVARGGSAADGEKPGLASMTGELLKDGGAGGMSSKELLARVESLGASLDIGTTFDRTMLSIAVTRDVFAEALDLLAAVAKKPAMNVGELAKLKKRMVDDAADRARTDGGWGASMMLYRQLWKSGGALHPYSVYDATATDLAKISANDCRALHKRTFVPKNMFVVVAGDVSHDEVKAAVERALGDMSGGEAPALSFPAPVVPAGLTVTLVDRPKSTQSQIYAGVLGPERASAAWPAFATANQILGGGAAGRLFTDVREKASLAYSANSGVAELAHGPGVLVAYAATQSNKTGLTAKALLDQLQRLGATEPTADEVAVATRYLADITAIRLETVGALANELVKSRTLGLPDDAPSLFRKRVREITPADAAKAAADHLRSANVALVVSGDAKIVGPMLSHFGDVKIVDPTKDFAEKTTLPKNADAPLELPEETGK